MRVLMIALALGLASTAAPAAQMAEFRVSIENHRFVPAEITVPAGQKIKLVVENKDASAEEFESYELNREKIVVGKGSIVVYVGPLDPGRYPFFGEFHPDTAQGVLVVE